LNGLLAIGQSETWHWSGGRGTNDLKTIGWKPMPLRRLPAHILSPRAENRGTLMNTGLQADEYRNHA
jgi:hypothetical protein